MAAIARGEQRRALVIAGGGFVLVLLLFVGSRILGGGGGDTAAEPDAGPSTSVPVPSDSAPSAGVPDAGGEVPVVAIPPVPDAFEALELRDPFTPPLAAIEFLRSLIPAPPTPGSTPAPGQSPAPGAAPAPASGTVQLRSVDLVDGREVATLDVEGTVFEAGEGERFGSNDEFMVVTLDQGAQCGTFLFGDEAFSLCAGQAPQAPPSAGSTPQK